MIKKNKIEILRQRFDEFKNVPAGHTQLVIFHILEFLHVQFPVHVRSTFELH
jgi:hypothetical protein